MEVLNSLDGVRWADNFGGQNQRRRWKWAWLCSMSLHAVGLGIAAIGTTSVSEWQTQVQRGDGANMVLVVKLANPSPTVPLVSELTVMETEPPERVPETFKSLRTPEHSPPLRPTTKPSPELASTEPLLISRAAAQFDLPIVSSIASPPRNPPPALEPPPASAPPALPVAAASLHAGARLDSPPQKLPDNLPPPYPEQARRLGQQGRVVLTAQLDASGYVVDLAVETSSGFPMLDEAAMNAVRQWRFQPAMVSDVPVSSELLVPVRFSMRSGR